MVSQPSISTWPTDVARTSIFMPSRLPMGPRVSFWGSNQRVRLLIVDHVAARRLAVCFALLPAPLPTRALLLSAEIELPNVVLHHQAHAGICHHNAADLQHVAVVSNLQRHVGVLLHQQDGNAALAVDSHDDVKDLLYQLR